MPRGARVFEVTQDPYSISTWISEDGGSIKIQDKAESDNMFFHAQPYCDGIDFKWNQIAHKSRVKESMVITASVIGGIVVLLSLWCVYRCYKKRKAKEQIQQPS
jgi:hypothetical protein